MEFVEFVSFQSEQDAKLAGSRLRAAGIPSSVSKDDCGGMEPHLQLTGTRRLRNPGGNGRAGGLVLASSSASAGLIDEYRLYYVPIVLGSGKAAFSRIQKRVRLKPVETRTFSSGTVLLRCVPVSS